MEIFIILAVIAGGSLLVFFFTRRSRKKDMYVKRERHIQAFPPNHRR